MSAIGSYREFQPSARATVEQQLTLHSDALVCMYSGQILCEVYMTAARYNISPLHMIGALAETCMPVNPLYGHA